MEDLENPGIPLSSKTLERVVLSLLGEAVGVPGLISRGGLHPDLEAFRRGIVVFSEVLGLSDEVRTTHPN